MTESVVPQEVLRKLPRTVREELPTLSADTQRKFLERFQKQRKKLIVAYPLALLYGLSFIYLEETSTGIWYWFTAGGFGIWYIINLFLLPGMVKTHNSIAALKLLAEVRPAGEKPAF